MRGRALIMPLLASYSLAWRTAPASGQEDQLTTFSYTRIYADSTGQSHFSDERMKLDLVTPGRGVPPTPASAPIPASGLRVFCPPAGGDADWHPVPGRVFNLIISSELEIEVSSGESRRFGVGSLILGEDTTGRGHRTRVVGEEEACFAMIMLAEE